MRPDLINNGKFQVFLLVCPANLPFSFATHPWFVINRKGVVSRWGVSMTKYPRELSWGHLNKNLLPPFQGIEVFPFSKSVYWRGRIYSYLEGDENSLAARMADFIESSNMAYPNTRTYSLLGPNSNTYVQWVLNKFPETNMHLPWNAFGKGKVKA